MPQNLFIVPIFFFFKFLKTKQTSNPRYFISWCNSRRLLLCGLFNSFLSYHRCAATLCPKPGEIQFLYYDVLHCLCVVRCLSLYACVCVCLFVMVALFSSACFPNSPVTPKEALGLQEGAVAEVPGWDASAEPHTMPDLLCAALLFNWNSIDLPRYRKRGAEEPPHKSVFRSASAELWTFLQSVFLELPGGREAETPT